MTTIAHLPKAVLTDIALFLVTPAYRLCAWMTDHVYQIALSGNPRALKMIETDPENIDWTILSANPCAIPLLEKNLERVNWHWLCINHNAIHLLENNLDRVDWNMLSSNPSAISLLEKNLDKVDFKFFSRNKKSNHKYYVYNSCAISSNKNRLCYI